MFRPTAPGMGRPRVRSRRDNILPPRRTQAWLWGTALAAALGLASDAEAFPDSFEGRLEALALLQTLNADLLSHDSATATLQRWCAEHGLAAEPRIVAHRVSVEKPADAEVRTLLAAGADEPIRYRRVALACGERVLSEADNWYRPGRLTAEMNRALETTETPFGAVVRSLGFHRRTLDAVLLFEPLSDGWERRPRPPTLRHALALPHELLRHRAVLETPDGVPFSLVVETYTDEVLRSSPPPQSGGGGPRSGGGGAGQGR